MGGYFKAKRANVRFKMEGIIAAVITGVLSLIGVVISNIAANAKMAKELEKAQAVTDTKIE